MIGCARNSQLTIVALNSAAWIGWEVLTGLRRPEAGGRWFPRVLATACFGMLILPALAFCLDANARNLAPAVVTIGMTAVTLAYFRVRQRDLFMLAGGAAVLMSMFTVVAARVLFSGGGGWDRVISVFILGVLVIGEVGAAAWWLFR